MFLKFIVTLLSIGLIQCIDYVFTEADASLIQPSDLVYAGAFRLPDSPTTPDNVNWEWSNWSAAATSYPGGDPTGPNDGYPGSLFGVGHDHTQYVSEISIPVPVNSATKNVAELNTAGVRQGFHDIKGSLFGYIEMPRVGLEYLSAQGAQTSGKLYFSWSQHLDEGNTGPTHGWCELNLSNPQSRGTWRIGGWENYLTADYIFEIPSTWAGTYTPNYRLATGRYRDGGQSAQGPALFTLGPWNQGNPPPAGTTLSTTPLLLYDDILDPAPQNILNGYAHSDEWNGGAWLTASGNSAVVFVGNKGIGYTWYGCVDGQECPPNCDCGETRGWWSDRIQAQMLFYDPADLARVAQGTMQPDQPQPYATMNLDPYLYHITSTREKHHISAVAFDRPHGLLYIFEPFADGEKPIVHVWKLSNWVPPAIITMAPITNLLLAEQVILEEKFESWPPTGWTIINNGGDCIWQSNVTTNYAGGEGHCAAADSYWCGFLTTMNTELRTPVFDLSRAGKATLSYVSSFNDHSSRDDYAEVDISTNGGSTWTTLLRWRDSDHDRYGPGEKVTLDLTPHIGSSRTVIRFHYYAPGGCLWWMIDNVSVSRK